MDAWVSLDALDAFAAAGVGVGRAGSWIWAGVDKTCLLAWARRSRVAASRFNAGCNAGSIAGFMADLGASG
ncbi:hypothetical protein BUPH_06817 [Paraburkholderia phenoliruptrix BR3459a]|uniref:Uncharacterized protein n=1 Tax=Paraburkholderia phenoliruptrix BR3459a TaxID=1229205 RepID=K0DMP7_9BURK|nr:hypothetical protein BUPH_06817 [Paraburkholderia phenoliruptrix BR3459a]